MSEEVSTYQTVTVLRSKPIARPDGRVAILLDTKEIGAIAFEVDQRAIGGLRQALAAAETLLHQSPHNTKPN